MMRAVRIRRVMMVLTVAVGATVVVTALAGANLWQLAKHLVAEDPGARVGGNTIVVTGNGERVLGVPDRPNFVIALGSGETISAGSKNSELGAIGKHDTIVVGSGHELVVGGADGEIIAKGTGHDLLVETHANATIRLEGSDDEVIVSGHDDHIVCSGNAFRDEIRDVSSDTVSKSCLKDHDHVKQDALTFIRGARIPRAPAAHVAGVSGDGSDDNPYTAPCDRQPNQPPGSAASCTVSFPARTLSGLWRNEFVPAYSCPKSAYVTTNFPYLVNQNYAPSGTTLPKGVEVQGLGPIGAEIRFAKLTQYYSTYLFYATGTLGKGSSATNWTVGSASYRVVLHCTNDALHSGYG
jgi:hypothetical protein